MKKCRKEYMWSIGSSSPMLPALDIIPDRRRRLGLTQNQLASLAGVSQSYIAKLEAGKIEPSYIKVKAIFEALDRLERKQEVLASEIMTTDLIVVQGSSTIHEAVEMMRSHGFSQLPVMEGKFPVGGISERNLLDNLLYSEDPRSPRERKVSEIMEEPFPQVGEEAPVSLLSNLLKYYPAALVQRKGQVVGIVTKADLLEVIS
jgi:predicted transcriptional regulator